MQFSAALISWFHHEFVSIAAAFEHLRFQPSRPVRFMYLCIRGFNHSDRTLRTSPDDHVIVFAKPIATPKVVVPEMLLVSAILRALAKHQGKHHERSEVAIHQLGIIIGAPRASITT